MKMRFTAAVGFLVSLSALLIVSPAKAVIPAGLDLGTDNNFAFIDLGASTLGWNSGPVAGNVLFGLGLHANLSGGNNGGISNGGLLFHDSTATISGSLQNPVTESLVPNTTTQGAATIAQNVSSFASSLAATQSVGTTISGTTTITGNGGLNVIDVANITNAKLTISGNANDFFVFNVSNAVMTNQPMTLSGVSADQILFNLTGTGTVFQTSGGDVSFGTYLATNGGKFQFSNLDLTGRLINIGGDVQLVSGSKIPVPEPGVLGLFGIGAIALACARKTSRK